MATCMGIATALKVSVLRAARERGLKRLITGQRGKQPDCWASTRRWVTDSSQRGWVGRWLLATSVYGLSSEDPS